MDKDLLNYIVSPQAYEKLFKKKNKLYANDGTIYETVKDEPILLPEESSAQWHRELIEALLWEHPGEIELIYKELETAKNYCKIYIEHISKILKDKQGILRALKRYSDNQTGKWIADIGKKRIALRQKFDFNSFAKKTSAKDG